MLRLGPLLERERRRGLGPLQDLESRRRLNVLQDLEGRHGPGLRLEWERRLAAAPAYVCEAFADPPEVEWEDEIC